MQQELEHTHQSATILETEPEISTVLLFSMKQLHILALATSSSSATEKYIKQTTDMSKSTLKRKHENPTLEDES